MHVKYFNYDMEPICEMEYYDEDCLIYLFVISKHSIKRALSMHVMHSSICSFIKILIHALCIYKIHDGTHSFPIA